MININLNSNKNFFINLYISTVNKISPQQQKLLIVASIAIAALSAVFLLYKSCLFKADLLSSKKDKMDKPEIKDPNSDVVKTTSDNPADDDSKLTDGEESPPSPIDDAPFKLFTAHVENKEDTPEIQIDDNTISIAGQVTDRLELPPPQSEKQEGMSQAQANDKAKFDDIKQQIAPKLKIIFGKGLGFYNFPFDPANDASGSAQNEDLEKAFIESPDLEDPIKKEPLIIGLGEVQIHDEELTLPLKKEQTKSPLSHDIIDGCFEIFDPENEIQQGPASDDDEDLFSESGIPGDDIPTIDLSDDELDTSESDENPLDPTWKSADGDKTNPEESVKRLQQFTP